MLTKYTSCSEAELRGIFGRYGTVQTCIVNKDKRHAFVKMLTRQDAVRAKDAMEDARGLEYPLRVSASQALYCVISNVLTPITRPDGALGSVLETAAITQPASVLFPSTSSPTLTESGCSLLRTVEAEAGPLRRAFVSKSPTLKSVRAFRPRPSAAGCRQTRAVATVPSLHVTATTIHHAGVEAETMALARWILTANSSKATWAASPLASAPCPTACPTSRRASGSQIPTLLGGPNHD